MQREDDIIPHQSLVEQVIDERIAELLRPVEIVMPVAFNDPDILTGIDIWAFALENGFYVPRVGDRLLLGSTISVSVAFDGTTPALSVLFSDAESDSSNLFQVNAAAVNGAVDVDGHLKQMGSSSFGEDRSYFADATPLMLRLSDTSDGDPNDPTPLTQGAAEVRLLIMPKGTTI